MQELFDRYVNFLEAERHASPYTVRNYTTDIIDFFRYVSDQKINNLQDVDKHVIRGYLSSLMDRGIVKRSIARKLSAIRSFYRFLIREKIVDRNPVASKSPRFEKQLPSFLTQEEIKCLLLTPDPETPVGLRDRALMELLYASGLRVSEIVGLNLGQLDLEKREIRVTGKGSKDRMVLMGEPSARALTAYLENGRPHFQNEASGGAIFLNHTGTRLAVRRVQKILETYANICQINRRVYPICCVTPLLLICWMAVQT